jgi:hypothetical protein
MEIQNIFHLKASARKKKSYIAMLMYNAVEILEYEILIKHATKFYRGLFGQSERNNLTLNGIECETLSKEDRSNLIKPVDMDKIKEVVFSLKHNKGAGPNGLPAYFFRYFGN